MYDNERLIDGTILTTSAATVFTNSATTASYLKVISLHNYGSEAAEVKLYDGIAGDATQCFLENLGAGETVMWDIPWGGIKKEGVEVFQAVCDVATTVNIRAFGGAE